MAAAPPPGVTGPTVLLVKYRSTGKGKTGSWGLPMEKRPKNYDIVKKAVETIDEDAHIKCKIVDLKDTTKFLFTQILGISGPLKTNLGVFLSKTQGAFLPDGFNDVEFKKRRQTKENENDSIKKGPKPFKGQHFKTDDLAYVNVADLLEIGTNTSVKAKISVALAIPNMKINIP